MGLVVTIPARDPDDAASRISLHLNEFARRGSALRTNFIGYRRKFHPTSVLILARFLLVFSLAFFPASSLIKLSPREAGPKITAPRSFEYIVH